MRILLTSVLALYVLALPAAAQSMEQDNIERADVATGIFNKACFTHYGRKNEAITYLDQTFKRNQGASRQVFLDFAKVEKGDVWIASFPKGVFAIVLSQDGHCHVLAQKADRERIHQNIAGLATEAEKNAANTISRQENMGEATRSSGFEVVGKGGKNMMVVVASTPVLPAPSKPDAVITMAINAD